MKGPSEVVQRALLERGVGVCEDVEHVVHHSLRQPDVNREVLEEVIAPDIIYHVESIVPDEELVADGARYSGESPGCCPGVLRIEDHDHCSSRVRVVPESHDDIIQLVELGPLGGGGGGADAPNRCSRSSPPAESCSPASATSPGGLPSFYRG